MVGHHWTLEVYRDSEEIKIQGQQRSALDLGSNSLLTWRTLQMYRFLGEADNLSLGYHLCLTYRDLVYIIWPWPSVNPFSISPWSPFNSRPLSQPARKQIWCEGKWALSFSCGWGKKESLHSLGGGRVQTWLGFVQFWPSFSCRFLVLNWSWSRWRVDEVF